MTASIAGYHIERAIAWGDITHAYRTSTGVGHHCAGSVGIATMPCVGEGTSTAGSDAIDGKGDFIADPLGCGIAGLGDKANGRDGEVDFGVA